ncbi:hypothetical protein MKK84_25480 [Methylobacterium sp. E-065]|uniref:hypothetical protein n=1 Tax=Methylobacterium sp. E-065 TaxID=2836583 RepID=UPI001FBB0DBB|nr:hypothetical protein [Methylobacterium sp. E-065]MCJ2020740.1 hypothetical protein [Methylobacterium sp. E-065]
MLDTIVWTAIFVGLFFGIVLICIDLLEEWEFPVGGIVDSPSENPTEQLKRLAQQLGKTQLTSR